MPEPKPLVEILGYIGGQNEELGGLCEPLIIRTSGQEHYVLYEMHTTRDIVGYKVLDSVYSDIVAKHNKLEFKTLEELMKEFRAVETRLGVNSRLPWVETDSRCGYYVPEKEFAAASARYWEEQRALRNNHLTPTDESRLP